MGETVGAYKTNNENTSPYISTGFVQQDSSYSQKTYWKNPFNTHRFHMKPTKINK